MVVVEFARGVGCEETNKNKNSGYDKGGGKRKALVIMARDAPETKMTKHQHCVKRQ